MRDLAHAARGRCADGRTASSARSARPPTLAARTAISTCSRATTARRGSSRSTPPQWPTLIGTDVFAGGAVDWTTGHLHPLRLALGLARLATAVGRAAARGQPRDTASTAPASRPQTARSAPSTWWWPRTAISAQLVPEVARPRHADQQLRRRDRAAGRPDAARSSGRGRRRPLRRQLLAAELRRAADLRRRRELRLPLSGGHCRQGPPAAVAGLSRLWPRFRSRMPGAARWPSPAAGCRTSPGSAPACWSASGYSGHGVAMAVMAGRIVAEAIRGEAGRFDLMAAVPAAPFPAGQPHGRRCLRWR